MSRKTISVDESTYLRLKALKDDGESWNDLGERAVNALESLDDADGERTSTVPDGVLTEAHIDDIVAQTSNRTAKELEDRLAGR